jgi:hypothetical protein
VAWPALDITGSKAHAPTRIVVRSVVRKPATRKAAAPKSRSHADSMVEMLKADPAFANAYLQSALEDSHTQEGREALLLVLRWEYLHERGIANDRAGGAAY